MTTYLDEDGRDMKPKQFLSKSHIGRIIIDGSNQYSSRGKMWYRDMKKPRQNFERKIKPTGYIYLPGSQLIEAQRHLTLISCLHSSIINSPPGIGKYKNKHELYRK